MDRLNDQTQLLWAKSRRDDAQKVHLLIYHLLDSAAVGLGLWKDVLSESIKDEISGYFNLKYDDMISARPPPLFKISWNAQIPTLSNSYLTQACLSRRP